MVVKVITYSLYGSIQRYTYNAIINCILAKTFFPGWICRFYIDDTVPNEIVQTLLGFDNVQIFAMGPAKCHVINCPLYWRMYAAADPKVDVVICRDVCTWLSKRDALMVDKWLKSDKDFHIIRDHCRHRSPIQGGTWGARNGVLRNIIVLLTKYVLAKKCEVSVDGTITSNDQVFLNATFYESLRPRTFVHGAMDPYPIHGEGFAENLGPYIDEEVPGFPFIEASMYNGEGRCTKCKKGEHVGYVGCVIHTFPDNIIRRVESIIASRGNRKYVLSFSLYNQRPMDHVNAVINCMLASKIYPGWIVRFYVDETVNQEALALLKTFDYVEIVQMPKHRGSEAMLWRFNPASDSMVYVMISRDSDSWISFREQAMVNEWLCSSKSFHIIRDHCYHAKKIMGGMWGVRNHILPDMQSMAEEYSRTQMYDQGFLADKIYPRIVSDSFIHDPHTPASHVIKRQDGYYSDGGHPIPLYIDIDEPIQGLSFKTINRLNQFECYHCKRVHETFVGGILKKVPEAARIVVKTYADSHGHPIDDLLLQVT